MQANRRQVLRWLAAAAGLAALRPGWAQHQHAAMSETSFGTSAAIDRAGRLWVAYTALEAGGANIVLQWTADEGRTWSAPQRVLRAPEPIEASGESRPKLAFGPAGQFYLSWTRPLGKPFTGEVRFTRSTDGGRTFSEPQPVHRDRALITHRFDTLLVDREGRLFVAWIDKRDAEAARARKLPYRGAGIYYAVSDDGGASFHPEVRLAEHSCECCRIALALDDAGRVHALWRHVFEPNVRDFATAVLPADGAPSALERASFDDWQIDACPHHGGALAFDGAGRRHQVWFNAKDDEGGAFYAAAVDGKLAAPQRLGGALAEHADVAAAGNTVAVVWKEFDGSVTSVHARVSGDGGRTWRAAMAASSAAASDHPHLVAGADAGIHLVWRTADQGIVIRRIAP